MIRSHAAASDDELGSRAEERGVEGRARFWLPTTKKERWSSSTPRLGTTQLQRRSDTLADETISIVLVEDHVLVREGTKALLSQDPAMDVVGEADTAEDAIRIIGELSPDIVLLNIRLREGSGMEVARALQKAGSPTKVLVVTAHDFEQYITAFVRAGVSGYLLKDSPARELIEAIHRVRQGQGVLPGPIAATVLQSIAQGKSDIERLPEELTIREYEVLELLMQDLANAEIGERLDISMRTAETHVANILG